jgi:hypothetical protein
VLLNLASLCLDSRENEAALRGFLSAAERAAKERVRVAARAGAAVAAARLGDRATLVACVSEVERALAGEVAPYERAQRLLTLSDAWRAARETETAEAVRERGVAVALAHGFAELAHEYGEPITAASAPPSIGAPPLGTDARRVVVALSTYGGRGVPH